MHGIDRTAYRLVACAANSRALACPLWPCTVRDHPAKRKRAAAVMCPDQMLLFAA
jgi:hypothetical protein